MDQLSVLTYNYSPIGRMRHLLSCGTLQWINQTKLYYFLRILHYEYEKSASVYLFVIRIICNKKYVSIIISRLLSQVLLKYMH